MKNKKTNILNIKQTLSRNFRYFSFVFRKLFRDISHFFAKINFARKKIVKKICDNFAKKKLFAFFMKFRIHLFHEKIEIFAKRLPHFAGNTRVNYR